MRPHACGVGPHRRRSQGGTGAAGVGRQSRHGGRPWGVCLLSWECLGSVRPGPGLAAEADRQGRRSGRSRGMARFPASIGSGRSGVARSPGAQRPGREEGGGLAGAAVVGARGCFLTSRATPERIECSRGACVASRDDECGETHGRARCSSTAPTSARRGARFRLAQSWALLHEESPLNNFLLSHGPEHPPLQSCHQSLLRLPPLLQWLPRIAACAARRLRSRARRVAPPRLCAAALSQSCGVPGRDRYVRRAHALHSGG